MSFRVHHERNRKKRALFYFRLLDRNFLFQNPILQVVKILTANEREERKRESMLAIEMAILFLTIKVFREMYLKVFVLCYLKCTEQTAMKQSKANK